MICSICAGASAEVFELQKEHSFARASYLHWGLAHQQIRFSVVDGRLDLDLQGEQGTVALTIDTDHPDSGVPEFDKTLRSGTFFDSDRFPTARFESTALSFTDHRVTSISGILNIKGREHPVTVTVDSFSCRYVLIYGRRACGANGHVRLLRSDWGMGSYAPFVSDEVDLEFSVEAVTQLQPRTREQM